jgi:hypothetical protein
LATPVAIDNSVPHPRATVAGEGMIFDRGSKSGRDSFFVCDERQLLFFFSLTCNEK